MDWLLSLDGNSLLWIQENLRRDWLDPIVMLVTSLGNGGWFWLTVLILMLGTAKYRKVGKAGILAMAIGFVLTNLLLKNIVGRIRPYEAVEGLTYLVRKPADASFPSGHSTCSMAASLTMFAMLPRKMGIPALVLGILVCLSRLYVGVHYPTDVLAGMLVGWLGAKAAVRGSIFSSRDCGSPAGKEGSR